MQQTYLGANSSPSPISTPYRPSHLPLELKPQIQDGMHEKIGEMSLCYLRNFPFMANDASLMKGPPSLFFFFQFNEHHV